MENQNGIRKEVSKSAITVSRVFEDQYRKGALVAELKQTVTTKSFYPSKSVATNMSDNIFGASDFGFSEQEFVSKETRVAWLQVPAGTTKEDVEAKLASLPEATLYRVMSNTPILTDGQKYAINSPEIELTLDDIAAVQAVRFPNGHESEGQLALDNAGKIQYRAVFFKTSAHDDIDKRSADPADMHIPASLEAELNGGEIAQGQNL